MVILFINDIIDKTMKNRFFIKNVTLVGALFLGLSVASCSDDDNAMPIETTGITMMADLNTEISEAAMGDFIAIHGIGLTYENIDSILVNDVKVEMLETYSEKDILYMQIPVQLPREETNKIYIYNSNGVKELNLKTKAPELKLTRMFNEYTKPGDTVMIYGDYFNLYEIDSLNAVVDFNGKESKVITSSNTYLTTQVPKNVDKNIKVKVKGTKWNVEAICPGRYYDQECMIMDFDGIMPNDPVNVATDPEDKVRLSGNYLLINDKSEYSGWWYIAEKSDVPFTDDMLDHSENYVVKCEFRTGNQLITDKIKFCNYLFWDAEPMYWVPSDFTNQKFNQWETITLPFKRNYSTTYPENGYYHSFNMRLEIDPTIARNFAFDNIRICKKGD